MVTITPGQEEATQEARADDDGGDGGGATGAAGSRIPGGADDPSVDGDTGTDAEAEDDPSRAGTSIRGDDSDGSRGGDGGGATGAAGAATPGGAQDPSVDRESGGGIDTDPSRAGTSIMDTERGIRTTRPTDDTPPTAAESMRYRPDEDVRQPSDPDPEQGVETGTTAGGDRVPAAVATQAGQFEQEVIEETPGVNLEQDVRIRYRDGRLQPDLSERAQRRVAAAGVRDRATAPGVDAMAYDPGERLDATEDVRSEDIELTDEGEQLSEDVQRDLARQAIATELGIDLSDAAIERATGTTAQEAMGYDPDEDVATGDRGFQLSPEGQQTVALADLQEQTGVDLDRSDITVEDGAASLTPEAQEEVAFQELQQEDEDIRRSDIDVVGGEVQFTEQFYERQVQEDLDIAAEAGEDFTIDRDAVTAAGAMAYDPDEVTRETRVELTAEGREDAVTSSVLTEGEVELDQPSERVLGFDIGGGTRTQDVESPEQLEFDDEGNLVNVTPTPDLTPEQRESQFERMGFTPGEAGALSALVGGAQAVTGPLQAYGQAFYEGAIEPAAEVGGDVGDITGQGARAAAVGSPLAAGGTIQDPAGARTQPAGEVLTETREAGEVAIADISRGPEEEVGEPSPTEELTETVIAGVGQVVPIATATPQFLLGAGRTAGEATGFTAEAVEAEGVIEGGAAAGAAGVGAGVGAVEQTAVQVAQNPALTVGALIGTGGVMGAASRVGPRTGLATRAAIQPGEEILGYGGYGLTRRVAGAGAADRLFPRQEPLIFSEEAAIRGAQLAGGAIRGAGQRINRRLSGTEVDGGITGRLPSAEVEAGRGVAGEGRVDVNVHGDITDPIVSAERRAGDVRTGVGNELQRARDFLGAESRGGEFTPADVGQPLARGVRGTRAVAERISQAPFDAFRRGRTGLRNLEVEAEAAVERGAEGMAELGEDFRRAEREREMQPSFRERVGANLRGEIAPVGEGSFLFDVETGRAPSPGRPITRGAFATARGVERAVQAPFDAFRRGRTGLRNLEVGAEAAVERGAEGMIELSEEARTARREMERQPSATDRIGAGLRGDVSEPGEASFLFDVETGRAPSLPEVLGRGAAGAAERVGAGVTAAREFGVRVDIGRPGRQVPATELDITEQVGAPFEGLYETETDADPYEPPEGATAEGPDDVAPLTGQSEVEQGTGVATQVVVEQPRAEIDVRDPTTPRVEVETDRRVQMGPTGPGEITGPEVQPDIAAPELGSGFEPLEGERASLDVERATEARAGTEIEAETEPETTTELRQRFEMETEARQEIELRAETETRLESELFDRDPDQGERDEFDPFGGARRDIIADFRDPLTGDVIETERDGGPQNLLGI